MAFDNPFPEIMHPFLEKLCHFLCSLFIKKDIPEVTQIQGEGKHSPPLIGGAKGHIAKESVGRNIVLQPCLQDAASHREQRDIPEDKAFLS